MTIGPFGEILVESIALGDDVVVGLCTADKIGVSSGHRYLRARRRELYQKRVEPLPDDREAGTNTGWKLGSAEEGQTQAGGRM